MGVKLMLYAFEYWRGQRGRNATEVAIANGFAIVNLPINLQDGTIAERRLTSLASFRRYTVIPRRERHKFIKSHILVFFRASQTKSERESTKLWMTKTKFCLYL